MSTAMIRRISGFAGLPLLSALASFILLPFIARGGGQGSWNALAIGQSAGALAAIFVGLGWPLTGPSAVASSKDPELRRRLYAMSLATRTTIFFVFSIVLAIGPAILVPTEHGSEIYVMALAQAATGLSPAWYCIATGRASHIARYDVAPRILSTLISLLLLIWTDVIIVYPSAMLIGGLAGTYFFTKAHSRRTDYSGLNIRTIFAELWRMRAGAFTTIATSSYALTPVLVVGGMATGGGLAAFVSADKLYRMGLMGTAALGNSLQGWVAEACTNQSQRRVFSITSLSALGVAGWAGLTFLGPWTTRLLFGDSIAADVPTCFWFGVVFLLVCIATSTGAHWLVPLGRVSVVLWSTVVGAAIGLPAMLLLGGIMHGVGVAMGLAIGEFAVTAIQVITLLTKRSNVSIPIPST